MKNPLRVTNYELRVQLVMAIYSYSRISAFEQCPLKYKYTYIDRIKRKRISIEAFLGNRFHEVMEHLYKRISFERPDLKSLKQFFNERWEHEWNEDILFVRKDKTAADYQAQGIKAIEDYYQRYVPFDEGQVLGLEREIITDLDATGRYRVRCIIDRLMRLADGRYEIHDYKSSGLLPIQKQLDEDWQLALYEIAVRNAWPNIENVGLVWHYVMFDAQMRSSRTKEQLDNLRVETIEKIDKIESASEFLSNESNLCEWCDFQDICPLFAHKFNTQAFGRMDYEKDDGQALVNSFAGLDAQKHELMARIKGIGADLDSIKNAAVSLAEKQGIKRLFGDNYVLNIKDDLKVEYPKKEELKRHDFEQNMKQAGLWDKVLDVSWSQLKALVERQGWSQNTEIPETLREFLQIEKIKRVKLAKQKGK
ncbi:MAG: PD-(D/E)XK nuclease family protein [Pseudomonadota bacterium]